MSIGAAAHNRTHLAPMSTSNDAGPSTPAKDKESTAAVDKAELEKILNREATALQRDLEVSTGAREGST